ncbi:lipocalin-like domain-containing protein [Rhizobium leguminosarum]|uniref:lipocalin-like domain-containing protein n=1 Tax=Rhizobium leguminosarum TaxID=384 RepID=UPI001FDF4673|nr:lipocalin-like domain-containing protein [Rhizobium leguminosarum]
MSIRPVILALAFSISSSAFAQTAENQVAGTWRMMSATIDPGGKNIAAYGEKPNGLLVFTPDMHFVEVLTDAEIPRFASNVRGEGTDDENRMAMSRSIGFSEPTPLMRGENSAATVSKGLRFRTGLAACEHAMI